MFKNFKDYLLLELNANAMNKGKLDISKMTYNEALEYLNEISIKPDDLSPVFEKNFKTLQKISKKADTLRKDMPRITKNDTQYFCDHLTDGDLDIYPPYHKNTDPKNKYPEHLKGKEADEFMIRGSLDGDLGDDIVNVKNLMMEVGKLVPTQKQIYYDQVISFQEKYGSPEAAIQMLKNKPTITSNENEIIDGHHRFAYFYLCDPKIQINIMKVDLPTNELLKLALAFGDARGNERNK